MSKARLVPLLVLLALATAASGCCLSGGGSSGVAPIGGGAGTGPATSLSPGFAPDPTFLNGSAGGPTDASTMSPTCRGFVPSSPSHVLVLGAAFPTLRLLVHSEADTTLVVRMADGSIRCNDDSDGFDPVVEGPFPQGSHEVFVGTYAAGAPSAYQLGITVNPALTPSTMTVQPIVATVPGGGTGPARVLREGVATVAIATGNLPGVAQGTVCNWQQTTADPTSGYDCRWRLACAGQVLYGDGEGGYAPCSDPSWPPGTFVADMGTTAQDRDPSFMFAVGSMTVRDDETGARGAYSVTLIPGQ